MAELMDRGINLLEPDVLGPTEYEDFKNYYIKTKGKALPSFEFWYEFRPDVLKRKRLMARMTPSPETLGTPLPNLLAFLHYYTIVAFDEGILYEVKNAQSHGASKDQILAVLGLAYIHAGPFGFHYVASSSQEYIRSYVEPAEPGPWPANWEVDADAFRSGLDFSRAELLDGELGLVEEWYERVCGEVPGHVRLMGKYRPNLLKAYRNRFENTIKDAMPKQMMAYLQLHWEVSRACGPGIREGVLMARGLGMTLSQTIDAIAWGGEYGGVAAHTLVEEVAGDILASWG
jgi:hypothetical protein